MKKIISLILAVLSLTVLFSSCSGTQEIQYNDNISARTLYQNAESKFSLPAELSFKDVSALVQKTLAGIKDIVSGDFLAKDADGTTAGSMALRYTGGASFDEYGIFHCKDADSAKTVAEKLNTYVQDRASDTLYRSYFPSEEYKLDDAEVKTFGNYVVYAVLSKENRAALFDEIAHLLEK